MRLRPFVDSVKKTVSILSNPEKEFHNLENKSLESVVGYYMRMLLLVAITAGIFGFLFSLFKAAYLDIFVTIDIQYLRMINYSLSRSASYIFFYLFAGTFLLFFLSVLMNILIRKLKYTDLLKIIMYSTAPLLFFGWIPALALPFIVWSLFLLIIGIKTYKTKSIKKDSINNRV